MAKKVTQCLIEFEVAVKLRDFVQAVEAGGTPHPFFKFFCPGCNGQVHPVGEGFDHLEANPECPLRRGYVQTWQPPTS
jgi:hypothetical protein